MLERNIAALQRRQQETSANAPASQRVAAEHEITKLIALASGIADRLGVKPVHDDELAEVARNVAPEAVLDKIEASEPRQAG